MDNLFDRFVSKPLTTASQDPRSTKTNANANNKATNDEIIPSTTKVTRTAQERTKLSHQEYEMVSVDCHKTKFSSDSTHEKRKDISKTSERPAKSQKPGESSERNPSGAQARCKQGFTIPKKNHQQMFRKIDLTSREYLTELHPLITQNFHFHGSATKLIFTSGFHVKNNTLQENYQKKKQELLSELRNDKELTESIAFFGTKSKIKARKICSDGVRTGNTLFCNLGIAKMGVCVQKYADVLGNREIDVGVEYYMIIFKIMRGRIKLVPDNSSNLEPTPNYDCHMSKNSSVMNTDNDLKTIYQNSQTYLYEYGDDGIILKPRQLLPIAVLYYQYEKPLASIPMVRKLTGNNKSAPPKSITTTPGLLIWKGQLLNNSFDLGNAVITSHNLMYKPVLFGTTINITHTLPLMDLRKKFLKKLKHISPKREIHYGHYFIIYNQLESEDGRFEELMLYLNSRQEAAAWYCGNRVEGFIISSSSNDVTMGLPPLKNSHQKCHCLFISPYSMAGRLNEHQGRLQKLSANCPEMNQNCLSHSLLGDRPGCISETNNAFKSNQTGSSKNWLINNFDHGFLHISPQSSLLKEHTLKKAFCNLTQQSELETLPPAKKHTNFAVIPDSISSSNLLLKPPISFEFENQQNNNEQNPLNIPNENMSVYPSQHFTNQPYDIPITEKIDSAISLSDIPCTISTAIAKSSHLQPQISSSCIVSPTVSTSQETNTYGKLINCDEIIQNGHLTKISDSNQLNFSQRNNNHNIDQAKENLKPLEHYNGKPFKNNYLLLDIEQAKDQPVENIPLISHTHGSQYCNNKDSINEKMKEDNVSCNSDFFSKVGNWTTSIGRSSDEIIPFLNSDACYEQHEDCATYSSEDKSDTREELKSDIILSSVEGSSMVSCLQNSNLEEIVVQSSDNPLTQFESVNSVNPAESYSGLCDNLWPLQEKDRGTQNFNKAIRLIPLESSNEMYDPRIARLKSNQQMKEPLNLLNSDLAYKTDFVAKEAISELNNNLKILNKQILSDQAVESCTDPNTIGNGENESYSESVCNSTQNSLQKLSSFTTIFNEIASGNDTSQLIDELKEVTKFTEGIMTKITNNAITSSFNKGVTHNPNYSDQLKENEPPKFIKSNEKKRIPSDSASPQKKKIRLSFEEDITSACHAEDKPSLKHFYSKTNRNLPPRNEEQPADKNFDEISSTDQSLYKENTKFFDVFSSVVKTNPSEKLVEKYLEKNTSNSEKISKLSLVDDNDCSLADKYITCTVKSESKRFLLLLDKLLTTLCHIPFKIQENKLEDELKEKAAVEKHILYERIMSVILKLMENKNLPLEDSDTKNEPTHSSLAKRCFVKLNKLCIPNAEVDKLVHNMNLNIEEKLEQVVNDKIEKFSLSEMKGKRSASLSDSSFIDSFLELPNGIDSDSISSTSKISVHQKSHPITFSLKSPRLSSISRSINVSQISTDQVSDHDNALLNNSLFNFKQDQKRFSEIETIPFLLSENTREKINKSYSNTSEILNSPPEKVEKLANFIANQAGISPHDSGSENIDASKSPFSGGHFYQSKSSVSRRILKCQNHSSSDSKSLKRKLSKQISKHSSSIRSATRKQKKQKCLQGKRKLNNLSIRIKNYQCHKSYIKYRSNFIKYFFHKEELKKLMGVKLIARSKYKLRKRRSSIQATKGNLSHLKNALLKLKNIIQNMDVINEDDLRYFWITHKSQLSLLLTALAKDVFSMKIDVNTKDLIQNLLKTASVSKRDKYVKTSVQNMTTKCSSEKSEQNFSSKTKSDQTVPIMSDVVTSTERYNEDEMAHSNPAALYSYCDDPNEPDAVLMVQEASSTEDRNDNIKLNKEYQQFLRKI